MAHVSTAYSELNSTALNQAFIDAGEPEIATEDLWINKREFTEIPFISRRYSGLGPMQVKPEGTAFPEDEVEKGNQVSREPTEYGKKVEATNEALRRDQHGILRSQAVHLGRSTRHRRGLTAYSVLNNSTDTSFTGYDALSLLNTAHTNIWDNSTYANRTAGAVSLSETGILDSTARLRLMTDSAGIPMAMSARWLHYRPTRNLTQRAQWHLASSGRPESADGEFNTVVLEGLQAVPSSLLTSTTAWHVMAEGHDVWLHTEVEPLYDSWENKDTGSVFQSAYMSLTAYFNSPRGVDGNPGA